MNVQESEGGGTGATTTTTTATTVNSNPSNQFIQTPSVPPLSLQTTNNNSNQLQSMVPVTPSASLHSAANMSQSHHNLAAVAAGNMNPQYWGWPNAIAGVGGGYNYPMLNQQPPAPPSEKHDSTQKTATTSNQFGGGPFNMMAAAAYPPYHPMFDPSYFMYAHMMGAAAMQPPNGAAYPGYPPPPSFNPMYPYNPMSFMNQPYQHNIPDDQRSIQSYQYDHFENNNRTMAYPAHTAHSTMGEMPELASVKDEKALVKSKTTTMLTNNQKGGSDLLMENNNMIKQDPSMIEDNIKREENRMTPLLHQLPHGRASFGLNCLIHIKPNDPCEGQPALVDLISLNDIVEQFMSNSKRLKPIRTSDFGGGEENYDDLMGSGGVGEDSFTNDFLTNYKLMREFPGPLVKDVTSKAQIIQFCQKNIKECTFNVTIIDPQSHCLLWEYLSLLVRQNGLIDLKTDISPLLLNGIIDKQESSSTAAAVAITSSSSATDQTTKRTMEQSYSQQDFVMINKNVEASSSSSSSNETNGGEDSCMSHLRTLLGAGLRNDAIDYCIKQNMWPHALFLASTSIQSSESLYSSNAFNFHHHDTSSVMSSHQPTTNTNSTASSDYKLLNKVKQRFLTSLPETDPITTCYQLLIGRVPSIFNKITKLEWNDWRRHLAMIVSNINSLNKDLVLTAIKTLGDSLATNGRIAASHFCYLLAGCQLGSFHKKTSKVVLIGSSHNQDFNKFCQINAIQATEIYEFAKLLAKESLVTTDTAAATNVSNSFIKYKIIYATRLLEYGLTSEAFKYVEVIARTLNKSPDVHGDKIQTVYQLASKLKIYDPDFSLDDSKSEYFDPDWLQELHNNYKTQFAHIHASLVRSSQPLPVTSSQTAEEAVVVKEEKMPVVQSISAPNIQADSSNYGYHNNYDQQPPPAAPSHMMMGDSTNNNNNIMANYSSSNDLMQQTQNNNTYYNPESSSNFYNPNNVVGDSSSGKTVENPYVSRKSSLSAHSDHVATPRDNYQANNSHGYKTDLNSHQSSYVNNQTNIPAATSSSMSDLYTSNKPNNLSTNYTNNSNSAYFDPYSNNRQTTEYNQAQPPPVTSERNPSYSNNNNNNFDSMSYPTENSNYNRYNQQQQPLTTTTDYSQSYNNNNYNNQGDNEEEEDDNASQYSSSLYNAKRDSRKDSGDTASSEGNNNNNNKSGQQGKTQNTTAPSQGLFGKVFSYIKPANGPKKMILPDDSKKSIVWDDKLKKYVNKDAKEDPVEAIKPPPIMAPRPMINNNSTQMGQQRPSENGSTGGGGGPLPLPSMQPSVNQFSLKSQGGGRKSYYSQLDIMADKTKKISIEDQRQVMSTLTAASGTPQSSGGVGSMNNQPPMMHNFFMPSAAAAGTGSDDSQQQQQ